MIQLSARLLAAASMVRGGGVLADIGTDHAYLPVFLLQNEVVPSIIASDIGAGPLNNARKTVEAYCLSDRIDLRLSDGLKSYSPEEVTEIVICGMGGNLIEEILTAAPWIRNDKMHLVLQPMTHTEDVRRYLCRNGFRIERETVTTDADRYYLGISAVWENLQNTGCEGYYYFGTLLHQSGNAQKIVKKQLDRVRTRLSALKAVNRNVEEQNLLAGVLAYYEKETS